MQRTDLTHTAWFTPYLHTNILTNTKKTKCLDSLLRLSRHFLLSFDSRKMSCMLDNPDFTDLDEMVLTAPKITGYLWNKQRYGGTWNNDIVRARTVLKSCWLIRLSTVSSWHVTTKYPQIPFTTYEKIIICEIFALSKVCKKISHSIKTRWKISIIFSYLQFYKLWSVSDGTYLQTSCISQFKIRQRSFNVVVFTGLFFRSLSMVALDTWYLLISVYVDSDDFFSVSQNGL